MIVIRQSIDDRTAGVSSDRLDPLMAERAQNHRVDILAHYPSEVRDTFPGPQPDLLACEEHAVASQLGDCRLKTDARSQGRFLKHEPKDAACQHGCRHALLTGLLEPRAVG